MLALFMHFCAAVLCFVMQLFSSSIVGTTHPEFCDDTIICWARRELVHHTLTAILCWHAISFPLRDQTKTAVMLNDWLAILFLRWYVMDAKLCHYSFRGTQSHVNKLCGQSKGRDIIFHLKKKNAEEVIFASNIFYKIFMEENDSFCGLTLRDKSGLEFKDFKYRTL